MPGDKVATSFDSGGRRFDGKKKRILYEESMYHSLLRQQNKVLRKARIKKYLTQVILYKEKKGNTEQKQFFFAG